jgi:hypothetical protein
MTITLDRSRWLLCGIMLVLAAAGFTGLWLRGQVQAAEGQVPPTKLEPAKVRGVKACLDCHKPEVEAWQASRHAVSFDKLPGNPNAQKYAAALGITTANINREGLCVTCHGLRAEGTATRSITGVSCESCHGASDGDSGWLNAHGSYGANDLKRDQETADHKKQRHKTVDKAGMIRPASMYALAKNCLGCHSVPNEELVNKGGHKAGSGEFELASWLAGDVAHNLFIDPHKNADGASLWMSETGRTPAERKRMLFVLGKLADLETALRNLAAASGEGAYEQAMGNRAKTASSTLDDVKDFVKELDAPLAAFKKIKFKLKPANKDDLLATAGAVAAAAVAIERQHNGSKLADLDQIVPKTGNGPRYAPK